MATDPISEGSTAAVHYSGTATGGAWMIVVVGLTENSCTNGVLSGTVGTASGSAGWYE